MISIVIGSVRGMLARAIKSMSAGARGGVENLILFLEFYFAEFPRIPISNILYLLQFWHPCWMLLSMITRTSHSNKHNNVLLGNNGM